MLPRSGVQSLRQEDTFKCYMHVATQSIYITIDACQQRMDVCCICGHCAAKHSGRHWTPATVAEVRQWPTFNHASANLLLAKKQQKPLAKERRKGKAVRGTCSRRRQEETKVIVVSNCAEDSTVSFDMGPVSDPGTVRTQPMRVAKLHGRIVVDSSNSSDPDPAV